MIINDISIKVSQERLYKYKNRINSQPADAHDSTITYKDCKVFSILTFTIFYDI
jgi:hypothetical protein